MLFLKCKIICSIKMLINHSEVTTELKKFADTKRMAGKDRVSD